MSWKDWLYIPKSDKVAIVVLLIFIAALLLVYGVKKYSKNEDSEEFHISHPQDYAKWKSELITRKEEEKQVAFSTYKTHYQIKFKEGETLELNSADTLQLRMIPGIGNTFARRIYNYKQALGGYVNIEQLNEVWGLDTYLYSQIIGYITLKSPHDSLYINQISFKQLLKHPYINYKQALVIDDIRTRKGDIKSFNRLLLLDEFTKKDIEKLSPYISFKESSN